MNASQPDLLTDTYSMLSAIDVATIDSVSRIKLLHLAEEAAIYMVEEDRTEGWPGFVIFSQEST